VGFHRGAGVALMAAQKKAARTPITPRQVTEAIARAAALDAGNRHMRRHRRTVWSADDARAAQAEFARLMSNVVQA
jgi:hypothetical protein